MRVYKQITFMAQSTRNNRHQYRQQQQQQQRHLGQVNNYKEGLRGAIMGMRFLDITLRSCGLGGCVSAPPAPPAAAVGHN
ncbi:hypothetical protein ACLKA6_005341 [Drosophila palustris]